MGGFEQFKNNCCLCCFIYYICTITLKLYKMENLNYLKLNKDLVLTNLKSHDDSECNFDFEFNGVTVAIDICKHDNSVCVYAADNVCYTFSKMYNNLNHAINGLNLWLKSASYKTN